MKSLFLLTFFSLSFGKFDFERIHLKNLINREMQMISPRMDRSLFFCPQGIPGSQGNKGIDGHFDLEGEHTIANWRNRLYNRIQPPLVRCDMESAVKEGLTQLKGKRKLRASFMRGPPGPTGLDGLNASQVVLSEMQNRCFLKTPKAPPCPFVEEVVKEILGTSVGECPDKLQGGFGPRGDMGINGLEGKEILNMDELEQLLCPKNEEL